MVEFAVYKEYFDERGIFQMSKPKRRSSSNCKTSVPQSQDDSVSNADADTNDKATVVRKQNSPISKTDAHPENINIRRLINENAGIMAIILPICGIILSLVINNAVLLARMDSFEENTPTTTEISSLKTDIAVARADISALRNSLDSTEADMRELRSGIKDIADKLSVDVSNNYIMVTPTEVFQQSISSFFGSASIQTIPDEDIPFGMDESTVIGTKQNGEYITFGELEGFSFCTYYEENGIETWFYGGLNEKGRWDGFCIMNDYLNDTPVALFESKYEDGHRIGDYKSVLREGREYILSNRTHHGSYSSGETYIYKNLTWPETEFKSYKPIRFDDCKSGELISYYNGEISNHFYNDKTGRAVNIQYNEDGTVRLFYQGNFLNGIYVDDRPFDTASSTADNTAYWIVLANDASQYLYYMGPFAHGQPEDEEWYKNEGAKIATNENPADKLPNRIDYQSLKWKIW